MTTRTLPVSAEARGQLRVWLKMATARYKQLERRFRAQSLLKFATQLALKPRQRT